MQQGEVEGLLPRAFSGLVVTRVPRDGIHRETGQKGLDPRLIDAVAMLRAEWERLAAKRRRNHKIKPSLRASCAYLRIVSLFAAIIRSDLFRSLH
jgi:hypothetical protein